MVVWRLYGRDHFARMSVKLNQIWLLHHQWMIPEAHVGRDRFARVVFPLAYAANEWSPDAFMVEITLPA